MHGYRHSGSPHAPGVRECARGTRGAAPGHRAHEQGAGLEQAAGGGIGPLTFV